MSIASSERGATAVLIAGSMLLLMGMLAIAVDLGFGFNERRADQTSADASALGGSLEMVITNQSNPVQAAVDEVYARVEANLDRTIPQADWAGCTDPDALAFASDNPAFNVSNPSPCISFSTDYNTFRVRLPDQETETTFGRVIGFDSLTTTAAAEARRNTGWGGGGDFPAAVFSNDHAGDTICIKTGASGTEDCDGSATGSFGFFRPYFYSAVEGDLSTMCTTGEQPFSIPRAMADGIDHEFSRWDPVIRNDRINGQWCMTSGVPGPPFPNTVRPTSGYSNQDITNGLVLGGSWPTAYAGRLDRGPYQDAATILFGKTIDNRPLWDFIDDSVVYTGLAARCEDAKAWDPYLILADRSTAIADTKACITGALATIPIPRIFTSNILQSQRLGHSPKFHEPNASCAPPQDCLHIDSIVPIFIDGIWAATSPSFNCASDFEDTGTACIAYGGVQGEMAISAPGKRRIHSATAIVLDCALMPSGTCPSLQDGSTGPLNFLYDLELTR